MKALIRFLSSKRARIAALAILGFAFLSFAAITIVKEIFGAGDDAGKVYRKLEGDRVLLMNRDDNTNCPIKFQGYADTSTASDRYYWWELVSTTDVNLGNNLKPATHSRLHEAGLDGRVIWYLQHCRHGNTYTGSYTNYQNYLPFSTTSYTITTDSANWFQGKATAATAGQIVMQNTPDAQVISSCYADGIGTIYFDCVNAFTGYKKGRLEVEVAYGVWKTNEAGVVANRDESSRNVENDIERDADGNVVLISEENSHEIYKSATGNVVTNPYARCAWVKANMTGRYWSDGIPGVIPTNTVLKLELPLSGGIDDAGKMNSFYRIWTPVQDAGINPHLASYCRGPMRFRIRRADIPWKEGGSRIPEGDLDGENIKGNSPLEPYNGLILIDNVIASFPAMKAEAVARGEYAKGLSNRGNVGWIDVLSTRCPAVSEEGLKVRAGLIVSSNTPPEQAINYNADDWITKATWKYRWRYLDQVTNDWREVTLLPSENGLESTETLKMEDKVGDVEFYYNAELNAPYYGYVDYSGSDKGTPGYTERIKSVEARFNPDWLGQEGLPLTLPSLGTDFFFRLREGKSEQLSYKLELRKVGTAEIKECEFYLTGDNTWRALFKTETNETFTGTWQFRIIGANPQNFWGGNAVAKIPMTKQKLLKGLAADDCWTSFNVDAATGYLMFQLNEDPNVESQMSYSIVHADYQDFTHWNSVKKEYFLSSYARGSSCSKDYPCELPAWNATSAENDALWSERFYPGANSTPEAGYDNYPAYYTFPSAYTPNGWEAGHGMWVCRQYRVSKKGGEMALQMEGQGRGFLEFSNSSAPHGLESISFNARVAQFSSFREFSYYLGKSIYDLRNYLFTTKVIMAENQTSDKFDGGGTVSLLGYYRPNEGGYEVRAERIDINSIRLSIFKWYYSNGQIVSKEVCRSKTVIRFMADSFLQKSSSNYGEMFVHCKTESDRTIVVGGLINGALAVGTSASGKSHFLVKFEDTTADRYQYGTYGFSSQNCPAQFINPLYYSGSPTYSSTSWTQNKDTPFKDYLAHYYTKIVTFPGSSTSMFIMHNSTPTYVEWSIDRGKFESMSSGTYRGVKAIPTSSPMEVQVKTSGASRWQTIGTTNIVGFGLKEYKFPVYSKDDAAVRLKMGGTIYDVRSDVVIDDVKLRQWRGESYDDAGNVNFPSEKLPQLGSPSNYVYLTSWVNAEGDVRTIDLQPMRARKSDVIAIRAPLMDGYDNRGIGLGMFSFSYENADTNCVLKLQYAKMNGTSYLASYTESVDTNIWTDVAKWDFSTMTDKERASGTLSHYLGMHGVQGVMRLIVDPQVIVDSQDAAKNPKNDINYGKITITSFLTRDEPMLDDRSWWGWNLRSSDAPAERIIYDGVPSEANLALILNNSVADDVPPNGLDPNENTHALYKQHVPFVQSPTFGTNIVGEISFKARKLNPADADAVIAILGARDGKVSVDSEWKVLKSFVVANSFYETFTYKTDPGQDFASFRVAVIGVDGVEDNYADDIPADAVPLRVLIDEFIILEKAVNNGVVHPVVFENKIIIYANLGASGKLSQLYDGHLTKNNEVFILPKDSVTGTNLVFAVDPWYELGSIKIDGIDVQWERLSEPRTYTVNVGRGATNDIIIVNAEAVMQKNLATHHGLGPENRYTAAIMDWLSKGTDINGNPWANPDSGEIQVAEYWPWYDRDKSERKLLSLTAMYWLDIDPTEGGWVFRAGTTKMSGPVCPSEHITNIRFSVSMMISNKNELIGWPLYKKAHAPYTLRGVLNGSSSHYCNTLDANCSWTSVTFNITGTMLTDLSDGNMPTNRVPLRSFVFGKTSFGPDFTAEIDVRNPWSVDSPAKDFGWHEWANQHKIMPVVGYGWMIDDGSLSIQKEMLQYNAKLE